MMASEGNQIEGGLAIAHGIPLLVVAEKNILKRGILDEGAAEYGIVDMNTKDPTFKSQVAEWCEKVKARPRVFLGYCGKAQETAEKLIGFLQQHEVSVREYKMDLYLAALYSIKSIEPREDSVLCLNVEYFSLLHARVPTHAW